MMERTDLSLKKRAMDQFQKRQLNKQKYCSGTTVAESYKRK